MSIKRTTFSESWFRIAVLKPRLHPGIAVYRQFYRGDMWHVLQDPVNNQHFRITGAAWQFLGLLDGRRTVDEAWKLCTQRLGDAAPTQGEALQLLGQLHTSNLLLGDMPADTLTLLQRYKTRQQREFIGKLRSVLFMKIPLWDPDRFLRLFSPLVGWIFSPVGMLLWILSALAGLSSVLGRTDELMDKGSQILSTDNMPLLYAAFVLIKVLHELGHGFACKSFGLKSGSGGSVPTMGVMLMLLTPVPFVDCSSAWTLRSKWQRVVVSSAGMMVELMLAAAAAMIWIRTAEGSTLHALAYNVMFVASVSTLIFNGNPLLRYDAYYMLSDLLEIPNLAQQSNGYALHLGRKYLLGVKDSFHPAVTMKEKAWLFCYAIASFSYRWIIVAGITLMLADYLFILGLLFGATSAWQLLGKPFWEYCCYLANHQDLLRCRPRAWLVSLSACGGVLAFLLACPFPDRVRVEGVVEPRRLQVVYSRTPGFIATVTPSGSTVAAGHKLVRMDNEDIDAQLLSLQAEVRAHEHQYKLAQTISLVEAQITARKIGSLHKNIRELQDQQRQLLLQAEHSGVWIHDHLEKALGAYCGPGQELGKLLSPQDLIVRAVASQKDAQLLDSARPDLQMRVKGRPESLYAATIELLLPVGQQTLPSAALGYAIGGDVMTSATDPDGRHAAEKIFEITVTPEPAAQSSLHAGQVMILRFDLPDLPLGWQLWRSFRQNMQQRFHIL